MPGAEEMALFDRIGALIRGEDDRFDLIIFDTAPTGHTLRLIRMPELMEAWIRALSRSRRAMLGIEQDDATDPVMLSLAERLEHLREFRARLLSPRVSAFVLVMVAERLPIEETARAIEQLEEAGVTIGGLVVNRVLPATSPDPFLRCAARQELIYLDEIDRRFTSQSAGARAAAGVGRARRRNLETSPERCSRSRPLQGERPHHDHQADRRHEFASFYAGYIGKVPAAGPVALLKDQSRALETLRVAAGADGDLSLRRRQMDREGTARPHGRHRAGVRLPAAAHRPRRQHAAGGHRRERVGGRRAARRERPIADVADEMIAVRAPRWRWSIARRGGAGTHRRRQQLPGLRARALLDPGGPRPASSRHPARALRSVRITKQEIHEDVENLGSSPSARVERRSKRPRAVSLSSCLVVASYRCCVLSAGVSRVTLSVTESTFARE